MSPSFAVGFMFLSAWEPGYSPQFAGWRVLPHFYAPESWNLPFRLGFVSEFSFQNAGYEENTRRVELRPILDRAFFQMADCVQSSLRARAAWAGNTPRVEL